MKLAIAAVALLTGIAFAHGPVKAETRLKMSSQWTENTVTSEADRWWASEIEKRTQGQFKVKIFYAGTLAKANENLQLIRSGGVDLVNMSAS